MFLEKNIKIFLAAALPYGVHCIPHGTDFWQNSQVPPHTEIRIRTLCADAIAAKDESDVERIIVELRAALTEHIREAKASLEAQAAAIAAIGRPCQLGPTEES